MDFYSGQDLLDLCQKEKISISSAMKQREITMGSLSAEEIQAKLETVLAIMKDSVHKPLKEPVRSIGGLLGGEAKKVADHSSSPNSVCGSMLSKAIAYSMAVLEVNASMGLIVACHRDC